MQQSRQAEEPSLYSQANRRTSKLVLGWLRDGRSWMRRYGAPT
jgi:hypothetical protein